MLQEFRDFIERGNVVDMAVGIVMGSAFVAIVNSFVDDMVMPIIDGLLKNVDFSTLSFTLGTAEIMYGNFIQAIITFVIIALVMFLVVRLYNKAQTKFHLEAKEEAAKAPPADIVLLTEIRDLLSEQQQP